MGLTEIHSGYIVDFITTLPDIINLWKRDDHPFPSTSSATTDSSAHMLLPVGYRPFWSHDLLSPSDLLRWVDCKEGIPGGVQSLSWWGKRQRRWSRPTFVLCCVFWRYTLSELNLISHLLTCSVLFFTLYMSALISFNDHRATFDIAADQRIVK